MQTTCLTCWIIRLVTESVFSALASHTTMQTTCLTCWIIRLVTPSLSYLPWHHATMQTACLTCRIMRLGFYGIIVHLGLLFLPWHHTTMSHLLDHHAGHSGSTSSTLAPHYNANYPSHLLGHLAGFFTAYLGLLSLPWHHTTLQTTSLTCWIIRLGFIWVCLLRF